MNGKEKFKKYFEPFFIIPSGYIETSISAFLKAFYYIFTLEIVRRIFKFLENGDKESFYHILPWYIYGSIFYLIMIFAIYKLGWRNVIFGGSPKLYEKYLKNYIQADGNIVEKIGTGRFINALDKGVHSWLDTLFLLVDKFIYTFIVFIYTFFFIANISIGGAWATVLCLIIASFIATKANIWMAEKRMLRRKEQKEAIHQATIALMSKNELLQSGGEKDIIKKIYTHFNKAKIYHDPVALGFLMINEFPTFLFLLVRIGLYLYIGNLIFAGNGTWSDFSMFVVIISLMERNIVSFLDLMRDILRDFSSVELLWETFENLPPIKGYDVGYTFKPSKDDIRIKNISYAYNKTNIFEDFSLRIEFGKKTAFVGASGGGKTTLLKLIAGYIYPQNGEIEVLGNNLEETALKSYYEHIGYLTQEPGVFDATIRENLESVMKDKEDEIEKEKQILEALRLAKCDFVFELEKGIETEIGERGIRLSGGQKQRLAIAKIFLKNPSIILLDEPTSALDSFSEESITEALEELFKGRTVIIVAHRLQTVKKADDIIVFEGGKVIERGKHKELVQKKGVYARMLELQSGF
ncbi:ABC transporter ATP-binding protein [Candidatus Gracilibacteria bacterium]|nr:ABC transporter ATP-binding protein [Candidatus Gracilibacteria bacterium]NUJ99207.1 ABC transporter ATP-binding protein [Candidatus Gracilibacteria bacterium]